MVFFMVWISVQCHLHIFQADSWNNDPMPSLFRHLVPCLTPLGFVFLVFLVFPPPGLTTKKKTNCHLCQCPCQCSQLQIRKLLQPEDAEKSHLWAIGFVYCICCFVVQVVQVVQAPEEAESCFRPHRPVRARFHVRFSVPSIYCNLTFFCIFSKFLRCMCTAGSCRRCKCIAPVRRNHFRFRIIERLCLKCYGMDCFGTYFTHVQTCNVTRVHSATEWTASVCTLHMSKPVM